MRFLIVLVSSLFVSAASAETCKAGDFSVYAGRQEVQTDKIETAPLYGASMNFGNQCFPVWGVHLSFGAKLAVEHSVGEDLTTTTVGAGPSWCFQFATGTGLCAAYLVRDSQFKTDEAKANYGSQGAEYGVTQTFGSVVGKAAYSMADYKTGEDNVKLKSYTLGLGYAL